MPSNASANDRLIPNDSLYDVITLDILTNGKVIDHKYQVLTVAVTKEANRIPSAKVVLRDGDPATETFEVSETSDFIPGNEIIIKTGRDGHNALIFKGVIVRHSLKARQNGDSILTIECKDKAVKMTVGRKSKYFEKVKDSDAISTIIGEYGLAKDITATTDEHKEIVQFNATDWDFMMSRADMNGLLVLVDDGKINLKKPDSNSSPKLTLNYGSDILEFETEMDAHHQWAAVEATAWDYSQQANIQSQGAADGSFQEFGNIKSSTLSDVLGLTKLELRHSGQVSVAELKAWADATMTRSQLSKIRGRAKVIGFSDIKPGDTVLLSGLGARFNGKAYVSAVRHEVGAGVWFSHIQFGFSDTWFHQQQKDIVETPASGLLPGINGLQIGIVSQLANDPDGQDRILVKLPIVSNVEKGIWTRVATLDAGAQRGSFFRPEVGDEVIVGFINDDPRDAVILGMLHSSQKPAPVTPADENNHIKGFVTRSQMKVMFDDEKKIINIETPAGNKLIFSEEDKAITMTDQNNNNLKMSDSGIEMTSPKDITIKATGKIAITATDKIDIKSNADVSIEGLNTKMKAQVNAEVEGSAGAKLQASGQTVVKGAIVMIN